ncbi:hypothetical protein KX729_29320 [Rhizobium sp. XQZ8]|uniref:hypothetical protein n=1 Tax=Rhizobium populisoli TaxID=2859785 RepID=UPI001CA59BAD|nr:hypothetical protein [Rhizobium populisoli]MBW6425518.1 hypothetical protein [Rhizobium populisoli]
MKQLFVRLDGECLMPILRSRGADGLTFFHEVIKADQIFIKFRQSPATFGQAGDTFFGGRIGLCDFEVTIGHKGSLNSVDGSERDIHPVSLCGACPELNDGSKNI